MTCDDVDIALAVAAVSGAVEHADRDAVRDHLRDCARCQEAARKYAGAAASLAVAAETVEPPPRLRARILDRVHADAARDAAARQRSPLLRRLWEALPQGRSFAAAGLAAAVAAVGVLVWRTATGPSTQLLSSSIQVTAPGGSTTAGRLIYLPQQNTAVVIVDRLPDVAPRVYELWLIRAGTTPQAAGSFTRLPDGTWSIAVHGVASGASIAATIEPSSDVTTPTGPLVLTTGLPS